MAAEKIFENKVKKYLSSLNKCWYTKIWGGGYQKAGIPDLLACINGVFFSIELKGSKGRPSDLQKWNTKNINGAGGIGIILYPEGFEEFKDLVQEVIQCNSHTAVLNASRCAHTSTSCNILTGYAS